jgi:hypothetical protein
VGGGRWDGYCGILTERTVLHLCMTVRWQNPVSFLTFHNYTTTQLSVFVMNLSNPLGLRYHIGTILYTYTVQPLSKMYMVCIYVW